MEAKDVDLYVRGVIREWIESGGSARRGWAFRETLCGYSGGSYGITIARWQDPDSPEPAVSVGWRTPVVDGAQYDKGIVAKGLAGILCAADLLDTFNYRWPEDLDPKREVKHED